MQNKIIDNMYLYIIFILSKNKFILTKNDVDFNPSSPTNKTQMKSFGFLYFSIIFVKKT